MAVDRLRIGTLQYFIRPVQTYEQFADQVEALVDTAADYGCGLVVFPEYHSLQLLSLGNVKRPIQEQLRDIAAFVPRYTARMSELARSYGLYIVGGTFPVVGDDGQIHNECFLFSPTGGYGVQGKIHMTRFEAEDWDVRPRQKLKVFDTSFGRLAIAICYDVEFPEIARAAARAGANIIVVPSCTDDRQGYLRVRYCAQARAIENQVYVIQSSTVGSLPRVPQMALHYGQAAILTPSDFAFARDGILAEGIPNQETMVVGDLNMLTIVDNRTSGTVLPLYDSQRTSDVVANTEIISL